MARPEKFRLGDLLLEQGVLSAQQLQLALDEQQRSGRKLGRIVVERSFATEEAISQALARQLRLAYVNLKHFNPRPELIKLLPEAQARRFRAVILDELDGRLRVGFADPTDLQAYDDVLRVLRREVTPVIVDEGQLLDLMDRVYRRTEEISGLARELTADLSDLPIEFGEFSATSSPEADEAPVVKLLQTVFEDAVRARASDIHVEPQEHSLRVRFRIDGVLHVQMDADAKISSALALRLKLMSGLDISEKRLPQDGRFSIQVRNVAIDVRISTMPTQYGESVVMRLLNQNTGLLGLDRLNMPPRVLERLRHAVSRSSGMVLVTGPTGSGKTTTLYAVLSELNTTGKKIITVEDPVEYRLPGINQVQVHEKIALTFERVLRSALRQDPDIVLVGEMRDQTTAEIGMRAAVTGHMVLSTLHTNDVIVTPTRLLDMGIARYMVAMSLQLVIAQRLLRLVCENCAAPHLASPQEREWLRSELGEKVDERRYVHGAGCAHCGGTGYQGRTAVYEMLEMSKDVVTAINGGDIDAFKQAARAQMAGETLRRCAVRLVCQGRTTIEEAMHISAQLED